MDIEVGVQVKPVSAITPNPVHVPPQAPAHPPPAWNNDLDRAQTSKTRKVINVGALHTDPPREGIKGHPKALAGAEAFLQARTVIQNGKTGPVHHRIDAAAIDPPKEIMCQPLWYRPSML